MLAIAETENASIQAQFGTMVRGEQYKLLHNRWLIGIASTFFFFFLIFTGLSILPVVFESQASLRIPIPNNFSYQLMTGLMQNLRGWSGIFVIILTAVAIGIEYQHGTIRVLIGRGVGRRRLLSAKLAAVMSISTGILLILLATTALETFAITAFSPQIFQYVPDYIWNDAGVYLISIVVSMVVTMSLVTVITLLVRSLGIGLALALAWFPVEGILRGIFTGIAFGTRDETWYEVTKYFLSTSIERLPTTLIPTHAIVQSTDPSVIQYADASAMEPVLAIIAYFALFLGIAYLLIQRRDVMN